MKPTSRTVSLLKYFIDRKDEIIETSEIKFLREVSERAGRSLTVLTTEAKERLNAKLAQIEEEIAASAAKQGVSSVVVPPRYVETLKRRNLKVRVKHYRWGYHEITNLYPFIPRTEPKLVRVSKYERKTKGLIPPHPILEQFGGETHVSITFPDGRVTEGVAVCSRSDPYCKKLGVFVACKRALKAAKDGSAEVNPTPVPSSASVTAEGPDTTLPHHRV